MILINTLKELEKYFKVVRDLDDPKPAKLISISSEGYTIEEYDEELDNYIKQEPVLFPREMFDLESAVLYIMEKEEGPIAIELIDAVEAFKEFNGTPPEGYTEYEDEFMNFDLDSESMEADYGYEAGKYSEDCAYELEI